MTYRLTEHAEKRMHLRLINTAWLEQTLERPALTESDPLDPSLEHRLAIIPEKDHRVLRVVCRPGSEPLEIITLHFDRSMKGKL